MRILIVNYRYFVSGGPETYMFNVTDALERRGHTVIPYSIRYSNNRPTEYSKYFADPIGSEDSVYYDDHDKSLKTTYRTLKRSFYDKSVEHSIRKCVQETKPDVAIVLHYKRKLSPAVLVGLKKEGIPLVVRFSDFLSVCPQSLLLRNQTPCMECVEAKSLLPSLLHRCVKHSYMASFVHYISELYYRAKRYKSIPARYIVPSAFSRQVLIDAGFHAGEIVTLPTFAPNRLFGIKRNIDCNKPYKLLYVGNMQEYKGNRVAVQLMPLLRDAYGDRVQLLMAGDGPDMSYNKSYIQDYSLEDSIQLLGHIESTKVEELYSTSYAILIPSLCYENLPNTLIEAMSSGLPVIGSDHGSIREHIVNGDNGLLATPNNITAWFKAACSVIEDSGLSERISSSSRTYAKQHFSESVHMLKLIKILEVIQSKS